ncbi:uncharacterized protein [Magallana gigas]|uniref:uncharacterized protein n=1 Tax=Magallana gigas TaxID=29159 RepID=UPI00334059DF
MMSMFQAFIVGIGLWLHLSPVLCFPWNTHAKKFRCPVPSKAEVDTCLKTDRCCSPEPVFEDTCFRGCKENCESEYSFYGCSNTCPPPPKENLKDCVNYDPLCSIHFMSIEVEGRSCFYGCVMLCV